MKKTRFLSVVLGIALLLPPLSSRAAAQDIEGEMQEFLLYNGNSTLQSICLGENAIILSGAVVSDNSLHFKLTLSDQSGQVVFCQKRDQAPDGRTAFSGLSIAPGQYTVSISASKDLRTYSSAIPHSFRIDWDGMCGSVVPSPVTGFNDTSAERCDDIALASLGEYTHFEPAQSVSTPARLFGLPCRSISDNILTYSRPRGPVGGNAGLPGGSAWRPQAGHSLGTSIGGIAMKQHDYQKMDGLFSGTGEDGQSSGEFRRWTESQPSGQNRLGRELDLMNLVCGVTLLLAAILGICFWSRLSDALFFGLLYPILSAGGQLFVVLIPIASAFGWLHRKFDRFWY